MDSSSLQNQTPFCSASPSWRNPDHPTAHDRFRRIFRDHWLTWCDLRLEVKVPPDQRAYVRKTVERMILCRDPSAGYARYVCPGCGFDRCVPFSCKTRFCPSCGKVKVDNWVNDIAFVSSFRYTVCRWQQHGPACGCPNQSKSPSPAL